VRYFAGGYYYVAKRQRQEAVQVANMSDTWLEPNGNPQPMFATAPHKKLAQRVRDARAQVPH